MDRQSQFHIAAVIRDELHTLYQNQPRDTYLEALAELADEAVADLRDPS